ncbi:MAG: YggT family protein [Fidelibacterota bacterium]
MFIFGYFFIALAKLLTFLINIYIFLIIIDTVLAWLRMNNYNEYTRFISSFVEPYLMIIRGIIPQFSTIDLSPLIGILILYFTDEFFVNVIHEFGVLFL